METHKRFQLLPYTGPKSRLTCPACGQPRKFTPYVDTETGEPLPDEYGRCDRETNCGYFRSPYDRPSSGGLSYATAIERDEQPLAYLAPVRAKQPNPRASAVVAIPAEVYHATIGHYQHNALARLLQQHFGAGVSADLLARFHVGTSAHWPGATVFWLLDEQERVRGGQVVLYDETGHTVKQPHRHTTWAHTALVQASKRRGQPLPSWLTAYATPETPKCPCLFGLSQLADAPPAQSVALVESAKTAIIAAPYFPRFIWLATMGLSYLTAERLRPLRGRRIVLFPDAGALDKWQRKAAELCRLGFDVRVSEELERLVTPEQRQTGFDLADVLLTEWPGYPPSWDEQELTPSLSPAETSPLLTNTLL